MSESWNCSVRSVDKQYSFKGVINWIKSNCILYDKVWLLCWYFYPTYLSRVLVNINVNNASMFVALLNHIILDLSRPVGIIFSAKDWAMSKSQWLQRLSVILNPILMSEPSRAGFCTPLLTLLERQLAKKGSNLNDPYACGLNRLDSWRQCVANGCDGRFKAWLGAGVGTAETKIIDQWISTKQKHMRNMFSVICSLTCWSTDVSKWYGSSHL